MYSDPPIIDGHLNDLVWNNATQQIFTLYSIDNQDDKIKAIISLLFSNNDTLYLGIEIVKTWDNLGEMILIFDTNNTHDILLSVNPNPVFCDGLDAKYFTNLNVNNDSYIDLNELKFDTENGGSEDFECQNSGSGVNSFSYELEIPFNSEDTLGYDINTSIDDELKFILLYFTGMDVYSQIREDDNDWDYGTIEYIFTHTVTPPPTTTSTSGVFINYYSLLCLFGLSITVFLTKKKK
ncbi:MAG: hypothetical protein ACTSO7_03385 [Candidatus Heimdallarchaeota archaeon]